MFITSCGRAVECVGLQPPNAEIVVSNPTEGLDIRVLGLLCVM